MTKKISSASKRPKLMRVVIKSSEWARGDRLDYYLLNDDGTRCCLGIDARACGVKDDELGRYFGPRISMAPKTYGKVWDQTSNDSIYTLSSLAMDINDQSGLTDQERIDKLRPIFREAGRIIVWRPDL